MAATHAIELINATKVFKGAGGQEVVAVKDLTLRIQDGEFFSLLGPSGCGKTTTLRMIAGFERPTQGEILVLGQSMVDIPPHLRPVNTVFQNYALFPHMTVQANIAFGLQMEGVSKQEITRRVGEALEMVQLGKMGPRKPKQLSGGQQQRIALARALVKRPAVLLLDEPLGALDRKLRKAMQIELKHLQQTVSITFIYVTHDQEEALTMSDRIAVMDAGHVLQVGSPDEIYEEPANRFVADFIGESNFVQGTVLAVERDAVSVVTTGGLQVKTEVKGMNLRVGQAVTLMIRPEKGTLVSEKSYGKGEDGWRGTIEEVVYMGTSTRYVVQLTDAEPIVVQVPNLDRAELARFHRGDTVCVEWAPSSIRLLVEG